MLRQSWPNGWSRAGGCLAPRQAQLASAPVGFISSCLPLPPVPLPPESVSPSSGLGNRPPPPELKSGSKDP